MEENMDVDGIAGTPFRSVEAVGLTGVDLKIRGNEEGRG
jgi:hypothetical protein